MQQTKEQGCLVVGYGSIGARHAELLKGMGFEVVCVSRRDDIPFPCFDRLEAALEVSNPSVVVVSSRTAEHLENCWSLAREGYTGLVLVEKPLCAELPDALPTPPYRTFIGYNLRFHPVVKRLRELLRGREVFSAQFSVGQYLPSWRPGSDYRKCYSSSMGEGGVLRDLSHELDLALWLFGPWTNVAAVMGTWGKLEIGVEDTVDILARFTRCPSVSIHLDYQNLFPHRTISVQADGMSLWGDLVHGILRTQGGEEVFSTERNGTYLAQWQELLKDVPDCACTWGEGVAVMQFIHAAERAAIQQRWENNL